MSESKINNNKNSLITAQDLGYSINGQWLLQAVNFTLHRGELVTLIGPNGAGKTTLVRLLLGLLKPTVGKITQQSPITIGYMPQQLTIDHTMPLTVRRFLSLADRFSEQHLIDTLTTTGALPLVDALYSSSLWWRNTACLIG